MKLVRKSRTTASQANRGKSVNVSIAEMDGSASYDSYKGGNPASA
jgi:hypothetical protein